MKEIAEVTAMVADHGIFLPVARRLAREFKKVYYYSPHEKAFPTIRDFVGDGFEDVERVDSIWEQKDCDLFVFPDIGFSAEQVELISQGKPVWGARSADALEIYRGKFLESLLETDLPVPPYQKIVGMSKLKDYLRDKRDKWIKISRFRGDWETMHFRNWDLDELELDIRAVKLGPWKDLISFYVFDEIETTIEDGCDTYCIDGEFPSVVIHGMEAKDKAYLGAFQNLSDLPQEVRCVLEAYGPVLGRHQYRSKFSCEVRITEQGKSYFIDPTMREGSPPSQVACEMIGNLGEIVWHGAHGQIVEPKQMCKVGVQSILSLKGDRNGWGMIEIDEDLDRWVKCGFCCKLDNRLCFPPDRENPTEEVGWVVGIGDTISEAIDHLNVNIHSLPSGCCCDSSQIAGLIEEIDKAEKEGMEFIDQPVPPPESVMAGEKT